MTKPITGESEYRALVHAYQHVDPDCLDDARFTADVEDLDDDDKAVMRDICHACPLLGLCTAYARTARPKGGYWAGKHWGRKERTGN